MFNLIFLFSFCTECTLEILPMVGLSWILGCLFWWAYRGHREKKQNAEFTDRIAHLQKKSKALEEELSTINFDWASMKTELNSLRNNYKELEIRYKALEDFKGVSANTIYEPVPPPLSLTPKTDTTTQSEKKVIYFSSEKTKNEPAPKSDSRKVIKQQKISELNSSYNSAFAPSDLKIIEGIGVKLEMLLKENGITTWTRLAVTSIEKLRDILNSAGPKYIVHNPSSWAQQAALARVGQWEELINLQRSLSPANKSKAKKLYKKIKGAAAYRIDDLKIIEGVGPKIEQLLKDGGIDNWSKLASATVADIKQILNAAGDRYRLADPGTWAKQAQYANEGKWELLKEYQNRLKGGIEME